MALPDWSPKPPTWSSENYNLLVQNEINEVSPQSFNNIVQNSEKFPIKFPVDTGRCKFLKNHVRESILERNINSVYPLVHESVLEFYCKFILFKRQHGSTKEKQLYKDMLLIQFIDRLLTKRAVMFMGKDDKYVLLNGAKGSRDWETIGTDNEKPPLVLQDCLSYDEIKLSVFLSVSSYTYFVNIGDRKNMAKYTGDREYYIEPEGIIVGMIGTRLRKPKVMEYQEVVIHDKQNTNANGYGTGVTGTIHKLFSDFYEEPCRTFAEFSTYSKTISNEDTRYVELKGKAVFDNDMYYKRLTISIDTLLLEANHRAKLEDKTAYVHVVGLGLGVWRISPHQDKVYMDAFGKRISYLGEKLSSVSDLCFSYIDQESCGDYEHGTVFPLEGHPNGGIKIHIFRRPPHEKLRSDNTGKLLVVSYAWDGNALPGNEYWSGKLGSSGDSAAASSTQIAEIHNPHINSLVCGANLMVVTEDGVVTFKNYQQTIRCKINKRKI